MQPPQIVFIGEGLNERSLGVRPSVPFPGEEVPPHSAELAGCEQDPPLSQQRREEPHDVLIRHRDHQLSEIPLRSGEAQWLDVEQIAKICRPTFCSSRCLLLTHVLRNRWQAGRIRGHKTRKLVEDYQREDSVTLR